MKETASAIYRRVAGAVDAEWDDPIEQEDAVSLERRFHKIDTELGKTTGKPIPPPPGYSPEFDAAQEERKKKVRKLKPKPRKPTNAKKRKRKLRRR